MTSQASHVGETVLIKDRREVGLDHIVREGAVAEHAGRVARRGECLVPGVDALRQRLRLIASDLGGKAYKKHPAANTVHQLTGDSLPFDRHAEVEAEL